MGSDRPVRDGRTTRHSAWPTLAPASTRCSGPVGSGRPDWTGRGPYLVLVEGRLLTCPHRAPLRSPEPPGITFARTGGASRRSGWARPRGGTGQAAHRVTPRVATRIRVPPARPPHASRRPG